MATKLYNSHLNTLLLNCKEYYILDTYISLVHLSSETNGKYIIQSYENSKSDLISLVKSIIKISYKTAFNCIEKLLHLNILKYDETIFAWVLNDMELMTVAKQNSLTDSLTFTGYTHVRSFFFTSEFFNMKAREKRLIVYMSQLADSKSSHFHDDFSMNLLKPNSSWLTILKTKCKYYAKYTIENLLKKYESLFIDKTKDLRLNDLSPKRNKNFKFSFACSLIKNKPKENDVFELIKLTNPKEYSLVKQKIKFANITLTKQKIMHLVRAVSTLKEWFLKERVVQIVINKYIAIQIHNSREDIKSISAYTAAVVRSVVSEYISFKDNISKSYLENFEIGECFIDYTDNISASILSKDIELSLLLF